MAFYSLIPFESNGLFGQSLQKKPFCGWHKRMRNEGFIQTFLGLPCLLSFLTLSSPYMKPCSALRTPDGLQHRTLKPKELSSLPAPHLPLPSTKACRTPHLDCSKQMGLTC